MYPPNDKMGMYPTQPSTQAVYAVMKMPNQYMQNPQGPMQMGFMNMCPPNSKELANCSVPTHELLLPDARVSPQYDDEPAR